MPYNGKSTNRNSISDTSGVFIKMALYCTTEDSFLSTPVLNYKMNSYA
jgi:hypothetical protein